MKDIKAFIQLIRPHQWIKNFFLFIPIFFAGELFDTSKLLWVALGFLAFCMGSSAVYIFNDYNDVESDRLHPEKSKRPIASGAISKPRAIIYFILMLGIALALMSILPLNFSIVFGLYVGINIIYSLGLKRVSILDLLLVSIGFVLRTVGGGILAGVAVSQWLIIMIFLLSMFLVIAKRRDDLLEYISSGTVIRKSIKQYNLQFINSALTLLSGVIIVSYILYTISPDVNARYETEYLYVTSIFVIVGVLRYLQITMVENNSGSPVKILYSDTFIHITLIIWILTYFIILYILKI